MPWRERVDADAIDRAQRLDPSLDVDALGASLESRIDAGRIRNPSAVFTVAAREAKERGTFRVQGSAATRAPEKLDATRENPTGLPPGRGYPGKIALERVALYAAAARGATPLQVAEGVRALARRPRFQGCPPRRSRAAP